MGGGGVRVGGEIVGGEVWREGGERVDQWVYERVGHSVCHVGESHLPC